MICSSTGLLQWLRFIFFSPQYNEVKQFKWCFASLATICPSDNFASRLKLLRFCAAFLTQLCSSSLWHLRRFFGPSFLTQKKHIPKVFLNSSSSVCSYHRHFRFRFRLSFCFLYTAIHDLWNKAFFSRKTSANITCFVEPYIFYLKHLVNHQNWRTQLNCRLSYGTNFLQGQDLKKMYCVLNINFQL